MIPWGPSNSSTRSHLISQKFSLVMSVNLKEDFLDKFFDLCREYQQEIPPQKMAEILREYADRLDEW